MNFNSLAEFAISLIYSKKTIGPRIDPWGTPKVIGLKEEDELLIITLCTQSLRYNANQLLVLALIPRWFNFAKRILWFTVSNALLKSRNTVVTISLFSKAV